MLIGAKKDRVVLPASEYTWSAEEFNQIISEMLNAITSSGQTPTADDLTQFTKAIQSLAGNDLAKRDFSNVARLLQATIDAIMPAEMDYIVESSRKADSWYQKYKSGLIEQGGVIEQGVDYSVSQFNLPITMSNDTYTILITCQGPKGSTNTAFACFQDQTASGFKIRGTNFNSNGGGGGYNIAKKYWYVRGY